MNADAHIPRYERVLLSLAPDGPFKSADAETIAKHLGEGPNNVLSSLRLLQSRWGLVCSYKLAGKEMWTRAHDITPENLLALGYREYAGQHVTSHERRFFQKRFEEKTGVRYFVEFREWDNHKGGVTYDAQLNNKASADGVDYIWLTFKPPTIEAGEAFAKRMWLAAGGIYYERF